MESLNKAAKSNKPYSPDPAAAQITDIELLSAERSILGFYVSSHPLAYYRRDISRYGAITDGAFHDLPGLSTIGGLVSKIRTHNTAKGEMAWVTLETGIESLPEITIFASLWGAVRHRIEVGKVVVVSGNKDNHPKFGWSFKVTEVRIIDRARPMVERMHVSIPKTKVSDLAWFNALDAGDGAYTQIAVEDRSGRIALIDSAVRVPVTGALLESIESRGWLVRFDPPDFNLPWPTGGLTKTGDYQGAGENRIPTWELPIAQLALSLNDGVVLAELTQT
jgi:DNA polymerase III alpha subunit